MSKFITFKQAKDYLASRIAEEAVREGVPFSEIERKMLCYSESDWTLPEKKQSIAEFDRNCDHDEYEQKIGSLIRQITSRHSSQNQIETEAWDEAAVKLNESDNYLSVLVNQVKASEPGLHGFLPTFDKTPLRPLHDRLKLWITAFGVIGFFALLAWIFGPRFWVVMDWIFKDRSRYSLIVVACLLIWFLWRIRSDLKVIFTNMIGRK